MSLISVTDQLYRARLMELRSEQRLQDSKNGSVEVLRAV